MSEDIYMFREIYHFGWQILQQKPFSIYITITAASSLFSKPVLFGCPILKSVFMDFF